MSWTLDKAKGIWKCTKYSDLNYAEINNLAEYGQPMSPYEPGFIQDFDPDFSKVIVEMPQMEVMTHGYGQNITADKFPLVRRFFEEKLTFPVGTYTFDDLVGFGFASNDPPERFMQTNLYGSGWGKYGVTAGDISALDAAYIHGTVSLVLMKTTKFIYSELIRRVEAEIGAGDDNWDFESSTIPRQVNAVVAAIFGPDHYNLEAPIQLLYRGPGKRSTAERRWPTSQVPENLHWQPRR